MEPVDITPSWVAVLDMAKNLIKGGAPEEAIASILDEIKRPLKLLDEGKLKPVETCVTKIVEYELADYLAKMCNYAQQHIEHGWVSGDRENLLRCTSFAVACFLAQNTVEGDAGVEWDVVLEELIDTEPMSKPVGHWRAIIDNLVEELGGWK